MELVTKKLADLVPYENNPRKNDKAVDAVVESIKQCGYVAPIIVDEENVILAGHTRYKALVKLGRKEAEVVVRAGLSDEQKRKYRILDNKTNEFAEWDFSKLEEELAGLDFGDFNFEFDMPVWTPIGQNNPNTPPEVHHIEPQFSPNGVTEGVADGNDPYLPEGYDDADIQQYTDNQENYVVKRRVIITYLPEQEKELAAKFHLAELDKVVYDIDELFG